MSYLGNNGITWKNLAEANIKRIPEFKNKHGELAHSEADGSDWSPAQWLQAVVGELGEYANIRKKYERGDLTAEEFEKEAGKELADVIIYLSILGCRLGIDLDKSVKEKFNEVSERVGSRVYIGEDWEYHLGELKTKYTKGIYAGFDHISAMHNIDIEEEGEQRRINITASKMAVKAEEGQEVSVIWKEGSHAMAREVELVSL